MLIKQIETLWQMVLAAMDGVYGWLNETLCLLAFVLVFNGLVKWILQKLQNRFEKQQKIWQVSLIRALYLPLKCYVLFFAAVHILDLIAIRSFPEASIENMHFLLSLGVIFSASWFCMKWKKNIVHAMTMKSKKNDIAMEQSKIDVMDKLATIMILFVTGLILIEFSDRSFNTLIALSSVGGLAIAFASQEVIANFFGGIMIYATHPFAKGDWIQIPDRNIEGIIEEIGWYMTRMRSLDKRPIYVPNSIFSKIIVITPSRMTHRQIKEVVGLRYSDMPVLKSVIADVRAMLLLHPHIDQQMPLIVNFHGFGTYSLDFLVQANSMVLDTVGFARVKDDILFKIAEIVSKHNAEMASPSSTLLIPDKISLSAQQKPSQEAN